MPLIPEFGLLPRDDDEGPFSRDINGQLIRLDAATEGDYNTLVTLKVNGEPVNLPIAEPLKDAQGNSVQDMNGRTKPRYTTILDAINQLNVRLRREGRDEAFVPTLCHQPHMTPVAVCRLCMVLVKGPRPRLQPACLYHLALLRGVDKEVEIFTGKEAKSKGEENGERAKVKKAVDRIAELLISDHLDQMKPALAPDDKFASYNELRKMSKSCNLNPTRFDLPALAAGARPALRAQPPAGRRVLDSSSPVFLVDHNACILCDRCIRACDEVVRNDVIGRTGKGLSAGIGFDLNQKMFESTCVQCGECMVSCPTTAITYKPLKSIEPRKGPRLDPVPLDELMQDPLFAGVPAKFLLWQNRLVLRRTVTANEVLCDQGEPGNCAFIIKQGRLQGLQRDDTGNELDRFVRTNEDIIVGEMACLSGEPRNAEITALEDGEVWEVRRNVLDRMMRSPDQQGTFRNLYGKRALDTALITSELLAGLPENERDFVGESLSHKLRFVRVSPRVTIFEQGDSGNLVDCLYLIRLGHVRVEARQGGREPIILYRGPNKVIGEMGLLALSSEDAGRDPDEVDRMWCAALAGGDALPTGKRTATCTALDHVELVRVDRSDFLNTIRHCPVLRMRLIKLVLGRLKGEI